jgi:hypothetical protein
MFLGEEERKRSVNSLRLMHLAIGLQKLRSTSSLTAQGGSRRWCLPASTKCCGSVTFANLVEEK